MEWDWGTIRDRYAKMTVSPAGGPSEPEIVYSNAMIVALIDRIMEHPRLARYKPGTMALILTLMPEGTSKRIFVVWDENHYEVAMGLTPDDPDQGKAQALPDEIIPVLERFAAHLESHPD